MGVLDDLLVGQSAPMREVKRLIELAAPSTTTILVQGKPEPAKSSLLRRYIIYQAGKGS